MVAGVNAIDFVLVCLGTDALYALGICGVCAFVFAGVSRPKNEWMEALRVVVFITFVVEHIDNLVGLVCF